MDDAKAQTDFWLNLWVVSLLSIIEYSSFAIYIGPTMLWFPLAALVAAFFASWRTRRAAVEWGDTVKASFDTFLPELAKKLKFPPTTTREEERELWKYFSNVIVYRSEHALHLLDNEVDRLLRDMPNGSTEPLALAYTVQAGETLKDIAQRFGTTEEALAQANNVIENPNTISVGQRLWVPQAYILAPVPVGRRRAGTSSF